VIRHLLPENVLERARLRLRWCFQEFDQVAVSASGGKDSTVLIELALEAAREAGRLPLPVMWLDQECEFESTVRYMREVMARPEVEPYWMQVPFRLFNTTTHSADQWLHVWGEGEEWVRPREPVSYTENVYGTDRFKDLLVAVGNHHFPGGLVLTGMRAEEAPWRRWTLTSRAVYKWLTWGAHRPASRGQGPSRHVSLAPLYDWSWRDIWKAIGEHGWAYNDHYDNLYRVGVKPSKMRVSNYHHETAVSSLWILQEVEPDTYDAAVRRLEGLATVARLGRADLVPEVLPYMFGSWREYRDYLIDHLCSPEHAAVFRGRFDRMETTKADLLAHPGSANMVYRAQAQSVVMNDWEGVLLLPRLTSWTGKAA